MKRVSLQPSQEEPIHSGEPSTIKAEPKPKPLLNRASRTKLSALLHQFNHAKKAQTEGYLQEAKELFLAIARSGAHPALGQESYLRALEISRHENDPETHKALVQEARNKWPNIKLQSWH